MDACRGTADLPAGVPSTAKSRNTRGLTMARRFVGEKGKRGPGEEMMGRRRKVEETPRLGAKERCGSRIAPGAVLLSPACRKRSCSALFCPPLPSSALFYPPLPSSALSFPPLPSKVAPPRPTRRALFPLMRKFNCVVLGGPSPSLPAHTHPADPLFE